jgi:hypothetical protein
VIKVWKSGFDLKMTLRPCEIYLKTVNLQSYPLMYREAYCTVTLWYRGKQIAVALVWCNGIFNGCFYVCLLSVCHCDFWFLSLSALLLFCLRSAISLPMSRFGGAWSLALVSISLRLVGLEMATVIFRNLSEA